MSIPPRRERAPIDHGATADDHSAGLTRRNILAGAAATTAAVTISAVDTPAMAHSADPNSPEDMILFVLLSAALTGVAEAKLAPGFGPKTRMTSAELQTFMRNLKLSDFSGLDVGSDPVDIKREYFDWVNDRQPAAFERLLRIGKESLNPPDRTRAQAIIDTIQAAPASDDSTKYLARSIVLMWYLGAWYNPDDLKQANKSPNETFLAYEVISPNAYTQGWIWQVAQAHPMGFSELQFGYWSQKPKLLPNFIG